MMKYGDNASQTRRLVSVFKDGKLAELKVDMDESLENNDMHIFRYLRRAAIINSISKTKYAEQVKERLAEEIEDATN